MDTHQLHKNDTYKDVDHIFVNDVDHIFVCIILFYERRFLFNINPHIHWVARGTGTPKDREEVNTREVCECDG
jgi:hypothetical protein